MGNPTEQTTERMRYAAWLKAGGGTWEQVAEAFDYKNPESARKSLTAHREQWLDLFRSAVDEFLSSTAEPTAVAFQLELVQAAREALRGESKVVDKQAVWDVVKVGQSASHSILAHCAKLRGHAAKMEIEIGMRDADARLIREARENADRLAVAEAAGGERALEGGAVEDSG